MAFEIGLGRDVFHLRFKSHQSHFHRPQTGLDPGAGASRPPDTGRVLDNVAVILVHEAFLSHCTVSGAPKPLYASIWTTNPETLISVFIPI